MLKSFLVVIQAVARAAGGLDVGSRMQDAVKLLSAHRFHAARTLDFSNPDWCET